MRIFADAKQTGIGDRASEDFEVCHLLWLLLELTLESNWNLSDFLIKSKCALTAISNVSKFGCIQVNLTTFSIPSMCNFFCINICNQNCKLNMCV